MAPSFKLFKAMVFPSINLLYLLCPMVRHCVFVGVGAEDRGFLHSTDATDAKMLTKNLVTMFGANERLARTLWTQTMI